MAYGKSSSTDPRVFNDLGAEWERLNQTAVIPVISRSTLDCERPAERRERLNATAAKKEELRQQRAAQKVQDVLADRFHQRPLASSDAPAAQPVPSWREAQDPTQDRRGSSRPSWAVPKPSLRMPRSMEVLPIGQGPGAAPWTVPRVVHRPAAPEPAAEAAEAKEKETKEAASEELARPRPRAKFATWTREVSGRALASSAKAHARASDSGPVDDKPSTSRERFSGEEVIKSMAGQAELETMPDQLRRDRDTVVAAVRSDGHALQHASEDLRADRHVVLAAVKENGLALRHAAQVLCSDQDLVLAAVRQNGLALQHAAPELRRSSALVLEALASDPQAARFVSRELLDDRDFVISATPFTRRIFEKASFRLKRDLDVVLEVVEQDPDTFLFAAWELRCDPQAVRAVVSTAGCAIAHASPDLRRDPSILAVAVANDPMARAAAQSG
ncbi:unnamed protein product [Symbiodinium natans]|uniref:DUF4116 domain-containing protein n=1 Tax=Symbiodinium natans TaxID=878477 RepID=A0A812UED9_9DINO|nr:unnamed protein product [Symbiodinium natans]